MQNIGYSFINFLRHPLPQKVVANILVGYRLNGSVQGVYLFWGKLSFLSDKLNHNKIRQHSYVIRSYDSG